MSQSNQIAQVETAIPAFIGYTEKAIHNGNPLSLPLLISSLQEYEQYFGGASDQSYSIVPAKPSQTMNMAGLSFEIKGKLYKMEKNQRFYLYDSLRLFFGNGGEACYIVSVGTYENKGEPAVVDKDDLYEGLTKLKSIQNLHPTLLLIPDALNLSTNDYYEVTQQMLAFCGANRTCMALLDVYQGYQNISSDVIQQFRTGIGNRHLKYGASYYPFIKTSLYNADDLHYHNIDGGVTKNGAVSVADLIGKNEVISQMEELLPLLQKPESKKKVLTKIINLDLELRQQNGDYLIIIDRLAKAANLMPPCPAIAGVYAFVDNSRGVWKAPANVSISMATAPAVNVNNDAQEDLNEDPAAGKSINAIRSFPGVGSAVIWGARTLAGNDNEWRYVAVRRFVNMIEQSIRNDTQSMVFEPNDVNTWAMYTTRIEAFMADLWRAGALAGPKMDEAFFVNIGLHKTMTQADLDNGLMIIEIGMAVVRPAEFILLQINVQMAS